MTNILPNNTYNSHNQSTEEAAELIRRLRQKEGSWVEWGQACAYLQKNGYNPQEIFESTGFEPIQQNQVIVGSQVYASIEKVGVSEATSLHYFQKGSDVLYELRLLNHEERAAAVLLRPRGDRAITHTRTHAYVHARTHEYTPVHARMQARTLTRAHSSTHALTHARTHVRTHTHTNTQYNEIHSTLDHSFRISRCVSLPFGNPYELN